MNAVARNPYTKSLTKIKDWCPAPKAILCISAHWMTDGTYVTHMKKPKTIYDFKGFPAHLSEVRYRPNGDPALAERVQQLVKSTSVIFDEDQWGLDHGTWGVLCHAYPEAKVHVVQMSFDMSQPASHHFQLGSELKALRDEGVFIIGSGNIVHNLKDIEWETAAKPKDYAVKFDTWVKNRLLARDFDSLVNRFSEQPSAAMSVPTLDHYLPFLYVLGAVEPTDRIRFEYEEIQNGTISMRCVGFGE